MAAAGPVFDPDKMRPDATWIRTAEPGHLVIEVVMPSGQQGIWYHRGFANLEEAQSWLETIERT